jgi:hypothetical protein
VKRRIDKIIIHCDDNSNPNWGLKELRILHEERGFGGIGYHYWIDFDGNIHATRPIDVVGCHAAGENQYSIGICLHGSDKFNVVQFKSLARIVGDLSHKYKITAKNIHPHSDYSMKTCPNFDVSKFKKENSSLIYGSPVMEKVKEELHVGIQSLVSLFDAIEALADCADKVATDGRLGIDDLAQLVELGKKYEVFVEMVKGLKEIPAEIKDLEKDEVIVLIKEIAEVIFKLKGIFVH